MLDRPLYCSDREMKGLASTMYHNREDCDDDTS